MIIDATIFVYNTFFFPSPELSTTVRISEYFGWEIIPDSIFTNHIGNCGNVKYSTSKYGFRTFGDIDSKKNKIFIIGDSFTEAYTVMGGNTYYDYLMRNSDVEIFAYGCQGYSTLQEFMVLDAYYDIIKPNVIVIQFCRNDYFDNLYELDNNTIGEINYKRPYYIDGHIKYYNPDTKSNFNPLLISPFLKVLYTNTIYERKSAKHSVLKVKEILRLMKKRSGDTPILLFSVDHSEYYGYKMIDICESCGIRYIPYVSENVKKENKSGAKTDCMPHDPHWNHLGHRIAGKVILNYLLKNGYM